MDVLGNRTVIAYDVLSNPISETDPLNRTVNKEYDVLKRLIRSTDPAGKVTQLSYDPQDRISSVTDPMNGVSSQSYDADSNRLSLADPNNNSTNFTYDLAGRLTAQTKVTGHNVTYSYNNRDLLVQTVNGRGQATDYVYDAAGRLTSFTDPTGMVSYTYDANGNILTVADANGTITREYDALNRITFYTDANGNIIRYNYDQAGNLITLTYPGGKQVSYTYDAANRLTGVTDWAGRVTSYEYDANNRLVRTARPNGTVETRTYDAAGQLTQLKDVDSTSTVISQFDFTYDLAGNVISETSLIPEQSFTPNDVQMTYTGDNRIAGYNGQNVIYDADGNMTSGPLAGIMDDFTYDSRNRLTGAGNTTYGYNAENHRLSVTETVAGSPSVTSYVVNPNSKLSQVLIQTNPDGTQTFYVYGLGLIGQEETGGAYKTYHFDRRGSTVALTDQSGTVTDRFQYTPYGELVYSEGETVIPFLYNGRYGVMTDNNGLYYMRVRYYNPEIKRFVNQDVVLGEINIGQSLNKYAYTNGNPVSYLDPFGLSRDSDEIFHQLPLDESLGLALADTVRDQEFIDFWGKQGVELTAQMSVEQIMKAIQKYMLERGMKSAVPVIGQVWAVGKLIKDVIGLPEWAQFVSHTIYTFYDSLNDHYYGWVIWDQRETLPTDTIVL